jgi:hypothetical protein
MRVLRAVVLLGASLLCAVPPAAGHDWLSECWAIRAETHAEFVNARRMAKLDCAGQAAYVAQQNWLMNQWVYDQYQRSPRPQAAAPVPALAPESAPAAALVNRPDR